MKTHYASEAEWLADFARMMAAREHIRVDVDKRRVERKVLTGAESEKGTSPLRYTKPFAIRRRG